MNRIGVSPAFLGKGWSFPVCVDSGQIATAAYEEDVRQAILIILGTDPGERVMRPDFGAGLSAFVFEPMTPTTLESLRVRVNEALVDWEPRIDVLEVTATSAPGEANLLLVRVDYRLRGNNAIGNLVYPFYLLDPS